MALGGAIAASLVLNFSIFTAFERTSIAVALFGFYTYPAVVAAAAVAIGEERLDRGRAIALVLALGGMAIVVLGGSTEPGAGFEVGGFLFALVAAVMQALYILLGRRGFRSIPSEEATFAVLVGDAIGFAALALVAGAGGVAGLSLPVAETLPALLWAGLAGAAVPTLLFLVAIRAIGPTRTSIVALLEPIAGAALAAVALHEALGPLQLAGGALVLAAAALLQRGEAAVDHEATTAVE